MQHMKEAMAQFVSAAEHVGVSLSTEDISSLRSGARWLAREAMASGLSQYDDPAEALIRGMGPALALFAFREVWEEEIADACDLGAGNGAIGAILALISGTWQILLVDRAKRAYTACEMLIARMGLDNASAVRADIEALDECCDLAVCRALAEADEALELARSAVRAGGLIGAWHSEANTQYTEPRQCVTVIGTVETVVPDLVLTLYRR